ncbi:8883_t:CDS:2 [Funneliformis caledonium]|uniref:8883_t:CDS:1 n=1 Tax=Funneliformis caledonium TaxID=1117310 RepID=A0A9N9AC84_9GLOM|nr:8883_t:CDS:2 [Funneliformis caledonium]
MKNRRAPLRELTANVGLNVSTTTASNYLHEAVKKLVNGKKRIGLFRCLGQPITRSKSNRNLWKILKDRIQQRKPFPKTVQQLKIALKEDWSKLESNSLSNLINSIPKR